MKLIIAGSRTLTNKHLVATHLASIKESWGVTEVVSGLAAGADTLGKDEAALQNIPTKDFPAKWGLHKKAAGPIRNQEMVDYADGALVFWDGVSKGTSDLVRKLIKAKKPILLIPFKPTLWTPLK